MVTIAFFELCTAGDLAYFNSSKLTQNILKLNGKVISFDQFEARPLKIRAVCAVKNIVDIG